MGDNVEFENIPLWLQEILFDPQTSGGLLFSVSPESVNEIMEEMQKNSVPAYIIGSVVDKKEKILVVR